MEEMKYVVQEISIAKIQVIPQTNRKIDSKKLQELQENIKIYGLMHPICVEKIEDNDTFQYLLIAGERRLIAYRNLGMKNIPAHIYETGNNMNITQEQNEDKTGAIENDRQYLRLTENLLRQDMSEMEKARAVYELYINGGGSYRKLADKLGLSKSYIEKLCKMASGGYQATPRDTIDIANVRSSVQKINVLLGADLTADSLKELENAARNINQYVKQIKKERLTAKREKEELEMRKENWFNEQSGGLS